MKIQEAIEAAMKAGESSIRRPIGMMRVRIIGLPGTHDLYGLLMQETEGPLNGPAAVIAHYELTLDDIDAINWSVAAGVMLAYTPKAAVPEEAQTSPNEYIAGKLMLATENVCEMIRNYQEEIPAADTIEKLSTALSRLSFVLDSLRVVSDKGEKGGSDDAD